MIKYIDLFSGIGGFHQALKELKTFKCVLASEIDVEASKIYELNHKLSTVGDITKISSDNIPDHDLICAGFPCQPFSKGGLRQGFLDTRGTLFHEIIRIAKDKKPKYLILENVPNIIRHDKGNTYKTIINKLHEIGYYTNAEPIILSPHHLGIPVHRPRTFIIASKEKLKINLNIKELYPNTNQSQNIIEYFGLKKSRRIDLKITDYERKVLDMWDEFYQLIDLKTIGFPIWFDYFFNKNEEKDDPEWKKNFIRKNKDLYSRNKSAIDNWRKKYNDLNDIKPTQRKFEWQCGENCTSVYEGLIQFRTSGVRVKRLNYFSTLVAINHSQVIGPLKRRLSR